MQTPIPLPLDIWHVIKSFIPQHNLQTHLSLSNTSGLLRGELYPSDASWKSLLVFCGLSRSNYDLQGQLNAVERERRWRDVVLEVVRNQRQGCSAEIVVGVDPGSEGVLGQIYWDELCTVQARKSRDCQLPKAKPLTPTDIENDKVELTLNPHLKLARPSFDALLFLDDTSLRLNNTLPVSPAGSFWELIAHHPTIAHSFATSPPATVDPSPPSLLPSTPSPNLPCLFPLVPQDLLLFFGQTAVHNPDGISVWDARQALLRNPALFSTRLSLTDSDKVVRGADTWLAGMLGPHVPPTEQAYRLARDGWEQEKPGSIRIGHASLFSIFSFDEEEEDDGE